MYNVGHYARYIKIHVYHEKYQNATFLALYY